MGCTETCQGMELIRPNLSGSATNGTAIGGGGIMVTAGHPSNSTIHHSYAIPAGIWCSSS